KEILLTPAQRFGERQLLDKNPTASRQALGPQIHDISDETHRKVHALLTDHQKELEKAMQQHEQNGDENRRSAPPAAESPEPSSSPSCYILVVSLYSPQSILHRRWPGCRFLGALVRRGPFAPWALASCGVGACAPHRLPP